MKMPVLFRATLAAVCAATALAADGNRLAYLDSDDPFYVSGSFPKLTTPQWIGEAGVEAVATLGIDDMRGNHLQYENFIRPILDRLKEINGRAPLSIFCNAINTAEPHFQQWLKEGVTLEVHTLAHPCPILGGRDFSKATNTFHGGVDLLNSVPSNKPVAFRTPCCDSINSPSPRLFAEIFNGVNARGQFLEMDSSIMNITSEKDPDLPPEWVIDPDGKLKYKKYLPFPSFVTTIENYPYPFVIGKLCWEMPPAIPSDWEAHNLIGDTNPVAVADWKKAIDITVRKQGVFNMVFHPYAWSNPRQIVEVIDHAAGAHGRKVKFLNFREARDRLTTNLLAGHPLRAGNGQDNGVRLLDLNNDGFLDVVIANEKARLTRVWDPGSKTWSETAFPAQIVEVNFEGRRALTGLRFGVLDSGAVVALLANERTTAAWRFVDGGWREARELLNGLAIAGQPVRTASQGRDRGARFRDVNQDGICELIISNESQNEIFTWSAGRWKPIGFSLPPNTSIVSASGEDNGFRFVDVNEDGFADALFSNEERFSLHLFIPKPFLGWTAGWTRQVSAGKREDPGAIPMIVRGGPHPNNGAWFKNRHLWVQNEDTAHLPDLVERRSFDDLLRGELPPPKTPEESLKSIRVPEGFTVELLAREPLIESPVAFEWDAAGRLYVVEFHDYPFPADGKAGGVIKLLEDTDGDARYDKAARFLENVNAPTGVFPWRKGVVISAAPHILYAEDTNGDGKADIRTVLFEGFAEGNQQHRVNGFEWGLDGWLYGANGDSGGLIVSRATGKQTSISGRDFRFRVDDGAFETVAGQTQFGRRRDDWGNWFGNYNAFWGWHFHLPEEYVARNPRLAPPAMTRRLAQYPESTRLYPISKPLQRMNITEADNHVTSANSPTSYRDELFGEEYANSLFISEPVYNAIHREVLLPEGVSFKSKRADNEPNSEFLASTDPWFRPTMLKTGPDGALYIIDMHRLILEHPEWIPDDLEARLDLRAGADKGRLYRVFAASKPLRKFEPLDSLDNAALAQRLDSPNGWVRDTAQRLLIERSARETAPAITLIFTRSPSAKIRLQALWTLATLESLKEEALLKALADPHPSVREHALKCSEPFLRAGPSQPLKLALLDRAQDPSARVRYQLAFSLGEWNSAEAGETLAQISIRDASSPDIQVAVASSLRPHAGVVLAELLREPRSVLLPELVLAQSLELSLRDNRASAARTVAEFGSRATPAQALQVVSLTQRALDGAAPFQKLDSNSASGLEALFNLASRRAAEAARSPQGGPDRLSAIELLGHAPGAHSLLLSLLTTAEPRDIQLAALKALARHPASEAGGELVRLWSHLSPSFRPLALDAVLRNKDWTVTLLSAIESKEIPLSALTVSARQQLLSSRDPSLRERAEKLLRSRASSGKEPVIQQLLSRTASLKGDPARGAAHFQQHCASCHAFGGSGEGVAPDLATLVERAPDRLLTAIIDPNRAVEDRYLSYDIVLKNGDELTGMITAESANSLTLVNPSGQSQNLLRADIAKLESSGRSLMPEGFEGGLDAQQFADLLAFISGSGIKPKQFAGNNPSTVSAQPNGELILPASAAQFFGETISFEPEFQNAGFWASPNDRLLWSVDVPKTGLYDLWIEWACAYHSSGNTLVIEAGDVALAFRVPGTGSWSSYRSRKIGQLRLEAGLASLSARAEAPLKNFLMDLKAVRLAPVTTQ